MTVLGITQAQAGILSVEAALDGLDRKWKEAGAAATGAFFTMGKGGTVLGILSGKIALFGAHTTQTIFNSVSVFHVLADAIIEIGAVLIPATVALLAFGAAAAPTVEAITKQMQNLQTVVEATGKQIYPLTGGFQRLADAVRPQVYQLFGEGLTIISHRMGELKTLAVGTGTVLDQLGARAAVAIQSGGMTAFLRNAVKDVATLGDIVGNIIGTIGNLLKTMPGYAQVLFNILDGVTKVMEKVTGSGAVQGLVHWGLVGHGAFVYLGLGATAAAKVISFSLDRISQTALLGAIGLGKLGPVGARAAAGMEKLAYGASSAAGLPWGVFALAAVGIGILAYKIITAKDATQQWFASLEQAIGAAGAIRGFTMLQLDQVAVSGRLATAQRTVSASYKQMGGQAAEFSRQGASVHASYLAQARGAQELTKDQKTLNDQAALYTFRLTKLGAAFGGVSEAQGLLVASGVTMQQMLDKTPGAFLKILEQVSATAAAYRAMGQTGGALGADMNALNIAASDQVTQMGKLNTAWDSVIKIVSGGQSAFISFQQDILSVNESFKQVGGTGRIFKRATK